MSTEERTTDRATCLIQGCEREAHTRGCCRSCYLTLRNRVAAGETTWKELEDCGLVLRPNESRAESSRNPAAIAFDAIKAATNEQSSASK